MAEFLIIAGYSGAGRSEAAKCLDDLGWFVIDNLPTQLISKVAELAVAKGSVTNHIALVVGAEAPEEPILFSKATSAIIGPNDNVEIPRTSTATDWEVELGIIIGKKTKYITESEAKNHIAGYCVVNDVSERDFQIKRSGQWTKGKSCDTFGPIGPYLVTTDEIDDVQNLSMFLDVNGQRMQTGSTKTMIFSGDHIVHYLSQFMTLFPGDVIATGTPPGVGLGMKPPVFLKPGDVMKLGIEGLGEQKQTCVAG